MIDQRTLIYNIARRTELPNFKARRAVKALVGLMREILQKHGSLSLYGLGTFKVKRRASRVTRHFFTGDELAVPAGFKVSFTPARSLKKLVK